MIPWLDIYDEYPLTGLQTIEYSKRSIDAGFATIYTAIICNTSSGYRRSMFGGEPSRFPPP